MKRRKPVLERLTLVRCMKCDHQFLTCAKRIRCPLAKDHPKLAREVKS
jgi:hypothetical protein